VLVVCGPSGTGKSHLVEALGHLAIDNGKTVAWHTLETLAQLLRRHRADDSINKAIGKLIHADLVVIDDVGLLPVSADAAEALFRVIEAAYEKRSIAISSNIHPSGFDELMPKSIATAPSTGYCTTPTSRSPTAKTATGSPKRPPARG
jgi:DNA replication protein DnaC